MIQLQKSYRSFNNYEALMQRQQEALGKVVEKQEAQLHQKRNFLSYQSRQPISGGGNVGDLPINIYRSKLHHNIQREKEKKLMDTMDMESKK